MSDVIDAIAGNPLLFGLAVIAIGALVYALLKRLMKLALVFLLGLAAVSGYYAYTGRDAPEALERVQDGVKRTVGKGAKKGAQKAKDLGNKVKDEVERTAKREAEKAAEAVKEELGEAAEKGAAAAEKAIDP